MERVDVVIVGGGPAGLSGATEAAKTGAEVVLLEKGVPRADREGPGPDSTDAAGILNYWLEIMDEDFADIPAEIILNELDGATFHSPGESVTITETGLDSSYDRFGFTFDRARFDDWLRQRAEQAGADCRIGPTVEGVETEFTGREATHDVHLASEETIRADSLILADGPQRSVTLDVLDQFLPAERDASTYLSPQEANHIAYQEHRRMPDDAIDSSKLEFWWGAMPGETAYPWIFPNDDNVARIGLTMPIGLDLESVANPESYALLDESDEALPSGQEYIRRLLKREFPDYDIEDFPLVETRGKQRGTEAYPISSTRPVESPTGANVAVVGGAMGATSKFHEGGDHVAVRTGKIAGELAGEGRLDAYNPAWKREIGPEIRRNVTMSDLVSGYGPDDWNETFRTVRRLLASGGSRKRQAIGAGLSGIQMYLRYRHRQWTLRDSQYVQLRESEYDYTQ